MCIKFRERLLTCMCIYLKFSSSLFFRVFTPPRADLPTDAMSQNTYPRRVRLLRFSESAELSIIITRLRATRVNPRDVRAASYEISRKVGCEEMHSRSAFTTLEESAR